MRVLINGLFDENYIGNCINNSFFCQSCILGTIIFIIGIINLLCNIIAFIKMTKFYKKLNFENTVILFSIIQTIFLQILLIISFDMFFEVFLFIQIMIISMIIRKFKILAEDSTNNKNTNTFFVFLNVMNFILFWIFPFYLLSSGENSEYSIIKIIYHSYHFIVTCCLVYYCLMFIKLTNKFRTDLDKSYYYLYSLKPSSQKDIQRLSLMMSKLDLKENKNKNNTLYCQFYNQKKKQISYLCFANLLCTIVQISFTILRNVVLKNHFLKHKGRTIPKTTLGDILYYFYLFVSFFNVLVNFVCFYWFIRHQYIINKENAPSTLIKENSNYLDEKFIERTTKNMKENHNTDVNEFLNSNKNYINDKGSNITEGAEKEESEEKGDIIIDNILEEKDDSKRNEEDIGDALLRESKPNRKGSGSDFSY